MSSTRTIADIEADIADIKRANPNWLGNDAHVALMTAYTNEKNLKNTLLSQTESQEKGEQIAIKYYYYQHAKVLSTDQCVPIIVLANLLLY